MFFNPMVEKTMLDSITGTLCMFIFPCLVYVCIFSLMVRSTTCLICKSFLQVDVQFLSPLKAPLMTSWRVIQAAGMVAIFMSLRQSMDEEIQEHKLLQSSMKVQLPPDQQFSGAAMLPCVV